MKRKPDPSRLPLLESVLGSVSLGMLVLDGERRIVLWNKWLVRYTGMAAELVLGAEFFTVFPALRDKRIDGAITQALKDNFPSLLSQTLNKAPFPLFANAAAAARDERMQQAVAVTPIEVPGAPRHCLIQVSDVSIAVGRERILRDQTLVLRSQTFSDGLTGIANRRHFDVALEKEWRIAKRNGRALSLLMIDIDYFKAYNDHYGHQQGDLCLIRVAAELASMLQRAADLVARYGGEEFAVILPETDTGQARQMAEAIRGRIAGLALEHNQGGAGPHVTVSVGIATYSATQALEEAELLGAADRALYLAKRRGRNRVEAL